MSRQDKSEISRKSESIEDEKPLKKARYVWEVKGKYHLKESLKNNNINKSNLEPSTSRTEQSSEEAKPNIEKKSYDTSKCCIATFLAKTEAIMDNDMDDNIDSNHSNDIPLTSVSPHSQNHDYYLYKWQAKQIARGFVDNTINCVLETWINSPYDADMLNSSFDADGLDVNCNNDDQIEDDAILMAIQSHGLQSNINENISYLRNTQLEESTQDNFYNYQSELIKEQYNSSKKISCDSGNQELSIGIGDHMDFLNAAVSVAIQKKGLSYGY